MAAREYVIVAMSCDMTVLGRGCMCMGQGMSPPWWWEGRCLPSHRTRKHRRNWSDMGTWEWCDHTRESRRGMGIHILCKLNWAKVAPKIS